MITLRSNLCVIYWFPLSISGEIIYRRERNIRWGGGEIYGITSFWRTIIAVRVYVVAVYSSWPAYQDPHGDFWNTLPNSKYPPFKEQKMQFSEEFFFLFFALLRQISRIRRQNWKIPMRVLVGGPWAINCYHIQPHSYDGSSERGYAIDFTSSSSYISFSSVLGRREKRDLSTKDNNP